MRVSTPGCWFRQNSKQLENGTRWTLKTERGCNRCHKMFLESVRSRYRRNMYCSVRSCFFFLVKLQLRQIETIFAGIFATDK